MKSCLRVVTAMSVLLVLWVFGHPAPAAVPEGEFAVENDKFGPIVRINVDRIKEWSQVPGVKQCLSVPLAPGQTEPSHAVISNMEDVDGDGRMDIFCRVLEQPYSQVVRFDDRGRRVWTSERLAPGAGDESGMPITDLDGDGKYELVLSQWAALYCLDAATGKIKWQKELDKGGKPGPGTWDYPMVVGHFADKRQRAVVVRAGTKLLCFGPCGEALWSCPLSGTTSGHALVRGDLDGDGYEEVVSSRGGWKGGGATEAVGRDVKVLWSDATQLNHSDNIAIADLDGDGRAECIYDHSGCGGGGPLYVVDGPTGTLKFTIDYRKQNYGHCQGFICADFDPAIPGRELAMTAKNGPLLFYNARGELLWKRNPPNTLCTKADWDGDGVQDVLVFAVGVNQDPIWSVWNGKGERLFAMSFLPSPQRSHATMCAPGVGYDGFGDRDGNGRADLLMAYGPWKTGNPQYLLRMECPEKK